MSSRRLRVVLSLAALAAGLILLSSRRPPPAPVAAPAPAPPAAPRPPAHEVLPPYVMAIAHGGTIEPGTELPNGQLPVVLDGNELLDVVVRPERQVTVAIGHRYFWVKGSQAQPWRAVPQVAPSSAFRTRASAERPFGAGLGELVAVISPVKDVPETIDAATLNAPPPHWQVLRQAVKWR
jgi:hypothetical protein